MVTVASRIALDSRSFDLFDDFTQATYSNQQPDGFTATFAPENFANVDGFGFLYAGADFPPYNGTITDAELFINNRSAVTVNDLSITMQQALAYAQMTPKQAARDIFSGDDSITGSRSEDYIRGFDGADELNGRRGQDTLRGDGDHDHFVFDTKLGARAAADHIADFGFEGVRDKIVLDRDIFEALGSGVERGEFRRVDDLDRNFQRDDHLIYNTKTDTLYYDADGRGEIGANPKVIAVFDTDVSLKFSDFLISG